MRLGQLVSNDLAGVGGNHILEEEVVCITGRGCEHNNDRNKIVLKQTSRWRVERPVASPDLGKGQDTFTAELLNNCIDIILVYRSIVRMCKREYILRPCEKITDNTLPNAERATKTDMTFSACLPNMFLKNTAATMLPDESISSFDTAAK